MECLDQRPISSEEWELLYNHMPICEALVREGVDAAAALPYLSGGLVGGWVGGKLYGRVPAAWLKWLFAAFLIYAGVKYLL